MSTCSRNERTEFIFIFKLDFIKITKQQKHDVKKNFQLS